MMVCKNEAKARIDHVDIIFSSHANFYAMCNLYERKRLG